MIIPRLVERQKLFEQVAHHLEQQILDGVLKPGDRLPPERDLQDAFGVGRPAIREALISLQRSGLIEIGNGQPARVARPTADGIIANLIPSVRHMLSTAEGNRQLQAVRLLVEVGLVRSAARTATQQDIDELRKALEHNRASSHEPKSFIGSDVAFHFVFARMTRNDVFLVIHNAMSMWLREQREVALKQEGEAARACEDHARILRAVEARDPDAAEAAMHEHLKQGWDSYWRHISVKE